MKWQPIETAPKDGTCVLLYGTYQWEHYVEDQQEGIVVGYWESGNGVNDWRTVSTNPYIDYCQPTHWLPLPEPPQ